MKEIQKRIHRNPESKVVPFVEMLRKIFKEEGQMHKPQKAGRLWTSSLGFQRQSWKDRDRGEGIPSSRRKGSHRIALDVSRSSWLVGVSTA